MKISKKVSKILIMSLFASNFSILSNATSSIEIPNRYEALEGEHITIDNSKEDKLHNIEILGNTIQNESDLSDIKSVGDKIDGKELYEIPIITTGKNLFKGELEYGSMDPVGNSHYTTNYTISKDFIRVSPLTKYFIKNHSVDSSIWVYYFDANKTFLLRETSIQGRTGITFTTPDKCNYMKFVQSTPHVTSLLDNIQIEEGSVATEYEPYQENKITILSPTPLEKVGDIADRIIYKDGVWGVEKNIEDYSINESADISESQPWGAFNHPCDRFMTGEITISNKSLITDSLGYSTGSYDSEGLIVIGPRVYIYINKDRYGGEMGKYPDILKFNTWLIDNNINIKIASKTTQFIPLPNSQQIKLNTFANKTHIFSQAENGVNPTIKVAVDRIDEVSQQAVEKAENEITVENLNIARHLVNQMEEGELKEEFQRRLNELSNFNDLQLERKTSSANVDIYIKSQNMLSMALSTNQITFEDYSGLTEIEKDNAITISINSSLPYELNAYMLDEIYNSNKSEKIDIDRLNIKDDLNITDTDYKEFVAIGTKLTLNDSCNAGNGIKHNIDLKLKGDQAYPADVYKTVIKFEAQQK